MMVARTDRERREALARLGLRAEPDAAGLRAAFRQAVKQTHPDRPGGDAASLRAVVAAYDLLKTKPDVVAGSPPANPPATAPDADVLTISPALAASGGEVLISLSDGRRLKVGLPAGLRAGDRVRAGAAMLTVTVRGGPDLTLRGDDLWLTTDLPGDAPQGGRLDLDTPGGPREIWIGRRALARGLVRISGQGLPARGPHSAGDLFVRLRPAARPESGARARLRAFQANWTAAAAL
ncbi:MAG: molecular chaperone DnaJ [Caulobacter sp.]|nr:molecular chaperone DnaJ [Caulobacter sp.]